jgi:hypothetical protein
MQWLLRPVTRPLACGISYPQSRSRCRRSSREHNRWCKKHQPVPQMAEISGFRYRVRYTFSVVLLKKGSSCRLYCAVVSSFSGGIGRAPQGLTEGGPTKGRGPVDRYSSLTLGEFEVRYAKVSPAIYPLRPPGRACPGAPITTTDRTRIIGRTSIALQRL